MSSLPSQVTPSPSAQRETQRIDKEIPRVIADAISELLDREDHVGSWMTDDVLRTHLKRRYDFRDDLDFTVTCLNRAISKYFPGVDGSDHTTNASGMFRNPKQLNKKKYTLYQFAKPGSPFKPCPANMDTEGWARLITQASDFEESLAGAASGALTRQAAKRQRAQTDIDITLLALHADLKVAQAVDKGAKSPPPRFVCPDVLDDTRIRNLFHCKDDESVEDTLEHHLKLLEKCINEPKGCCEVLPAPGDPDGLHTEKEAMNLRIRSQALFMAYSVA